ncbi:unnamed protein product [Aphanomyces euteiches]
MSDDLKEERASESVATEDSAAIAPPPLPAALPLDDVDVLKSDTSKNSQESPSLHELPMAGVPRLLLLEHAAKDEDDAVEAKTSSLLLLPVEDAAEARDLDLMTPDRVVPSEGAAVGGSFGSFASTGRPSATPVKPQRHETPKTAAGDASSPSIPLTIEIPVRTDSTLGSSSPPRATAMERSPKAELSPIHINVPTSPRRRSSSPLASPLSPRRDAIATDWIECRTETGYTYYYNTQQQVSQWTRPPDLPCDDRLHVAVSHGDLDRVSALLAAGAAVDGLDDQGRTALWYALEHLEIAQLLLSHGASPAVPDLHGTTLLHVVTRQRNVEMLALLLSSRLDLDARDARDQTALHVAATFGFRKCVAMLLAAGASPAILDANSQTPIMLSTLGNHVGCVQILQVALAERMERVHEIESLPGDATKVQALEAQLQATANALEAAETANAALQQEMTQLRHDMAKDHHEAEAKETAYRIANARIAMLEALLKRTNDEHERERALWHSKEAGLQEELAACLETTRILQIDVDAVVERQNLATHSAPLLQSPRDVDHVEQQEEERIPARRASSPKQNGFVDETRRPSIPPERVDAIWTQFFQNAVKMNGSSGGNVEHGMHTAVVEGNVELVESLLASGHSPNQRDRLDRTPLHLASDRGNHELLALLCEYLGDIEARDAKGNTPLHIACFRGHSSCVQFLLESAADVSVVNADGDSVVHAAAASGSLPCLQLVIEYGASPHVRNNQGDKAYEVLLEKDEPQLLEFLQDAMTDEEPQPAEDMDEFASPPSSPLKTRLHGEGTNARDGWGGWIRGTASSMFGISSSQTKVPPPPPPMQLDDAALKPPTDAEVLNAAKYHELVPPAHVYEAMQRVQIFLRLDALAAIDGRDGMMQATDVRYDDEIELETQPLIEDGRIFVSKMTLRVKTLSEKPLTIEINGTATVGELKEMIKAQGNAQGKFLRLIHQGKMLNDDKAILLDCQIKQNDFIHCAMSNAPPKALVQQLNNQEEAIEEPQNRRGFDCLRDTLSREEVQALRLHFYPQVSAMISQSTAREGESVEDRIYRIEEEWMAAQGPQSEFALNVRPRNMDSQETFHRIDMPDMSLMGIDNEGTTVDMIWGIAMGLILGFFMLFLLWERTIPRRQKMGIVIGVAINMLLTFVQRMTPDGN